MKRNRVRRPTLRACLGSWISQNIWRISDVLRTCHDVPQRYAIVDLLRRTEHPIVSGKRQTYGGSINPLDRLTWLPLGNTRAGELPAAYEIV